MVETPVYVLISDSTTYNDAIATLDRTYSKPVSEIFARHRLNTCGQKTNETLEEFFQRLKKFSADCNFKAVSAVENTEAAVRDAFIAGICSGYIRQRLLEENVMSLREVF